MKIPAVLFFFLLMGAPSLFSSDSIRSKTLPDSIASCIAPREDSGGCKKRVQYYLRRLSAVQLLVNENKDLLMAYCSGVKDERLSILLGNQQLAREQLGEVFYDRFVRHAFQIDFKEAVRARDESILTLIDEYLLKRYLEPEDYLEGFTGLYQRYFIETGQWKNYNFEVMRYFGEQRDQEYLYAEVEECLASLSHQKEVMLYAFGWLEYLSKEGKTFRNELLKGQVAYYLANIKEMKKHFRTAQRLADRIVEINYLKQVENEILER